jgi:hypothetical protein
MSRANLPLGQQPSLHQASAGDAGQHAARRDQGEGLFPKGFFRCCTRITRRAA